MISNQIVYRLLVRRLKILKLSELYNTSLPLFIVFIAYPYEYEGFLFHIGIISAKLIPPHRPQVNEKEVVFTI